MPGKVVRVLVNKGDPVRARQPMVVIEAMKMENELRAGRDGVITELPVSSGQSVEAGTLIAVVSTSGSAAPQSD
jgi:biotin carboxyl carrier protein